MRKREQARIAQEEAAAAREELRQTEISLRERIRIAEDAGTELEGRLAEAESERVAAVAREVDAARQQILHHVKALEQRVEELSEARSLAVKVFV